MLRMIRIIRTWQKDDQFYWKFNYFPTIHDFVVCLCTQVVYIAINMDPYQTAPKGAVWSEFIVFASMIKTSLKCVCKYASDELSAKHA